MELSQILDDPSDTKYTLHLEQGGGVGLTQGSNNKFLTIESWTDTFSIFSSVYRQNYPECTEGLATYQHVIRNIARSGGNWYTYDCNFRRLKQTASDLEWEALEQELYCMAMAPHRKSNSTNRFHSSKPNNNFRPQTCHCYKYNKGNHCEGCKYPHVCSKCGGKNPVFKCFDRQQTKFSDPKQSTSTTK